MSQIAISEKWLFVAFPWFAFAIWFLVAFDLRSFSMTFVMMGIGVAIAMFSVIDVKTDGMKTARRGVN